MTSREVLLDFKYAEKIKYVLNKPLGNVSAIVVMQASSKHCPIMSRRSFWTWR